MVWSTIGGGQKQLRDQCDICGDLVGPAKPKHLARPDTPAADTQRRKAWKEEYERRVDEAKRQLEARNARWWDRYTEYLKSPEWQKKRLMVLTRASGMCEGCGQRPATQVHHLTYKHVFHEFLFELVAICDECHDRAHPREEEESNAA